MLEAFCYGTTLRDSLRRVVSTAQANLAVAFWGDGAAGHLGIPTHAPGIRIVCDAFSGACSPDALQDLISRKVQLRTLNRLHAKVYIGRDTLIVGSANASSNGLCLGQEELEPGLEAALISHNAENIDQANQWFEQIFTQSCALEAPDFRLIRKMWLDRHRRRPGYPVSPTKSVSTGRLAHLQGRRIFVFYIDAEYKPPEKIEEDAKKSEYKYEITPDDPCPYYWDTIKWNGAVQSDDIIIDFLALPGEGIQTHVYKVLGFTSGGNIAFVSKDVRSLHFSVTLSDIDRIKTLVKQSVHKDSLPVGFPVALDSIIDSPVIASTNLQSS